MEDPKKSGAALRVNDDDGKAETEPAKDPKAGMPPISEVEETSAEGGPELRDVGMPDGVDRPDGTRKP